MRNKFENTKKFMSGKGYYIALVLCAIAIGISGYMYYRTANKPQQLSVPEVSAAVTQPEKELPVIITDPQLTPGSTQPVPTTKPTEPTKPQSMKTASPLEGETVSAFAMDRLSYNPTTRDWRVHNGVDIAAQAGTKVCAAAAGEVRKVYEDERMGYTVVIAHRDGYETVYQSLSEEVTVKVGEQVKLGQQIGTVGASALLESAIGDHLHFAVTCNGKAVDPAKFLKQN